ncbi:MAG TPA: TRAP transporter large permease [Syntrophorhabdaceae bacterium]|nr:TRAP transporter large permease [Syntrophorhabdaceae bacterium]HQM81599.1 TRAP transporter large permease [Syntrophorhabdaceae bacterium]
MLNGLIVVFITLLFLLSGMPLVFAFGISGLICGFLLGGTGAVTMLAQVIYHSVDSFELLTIPLFVFMGIVITVAPAGRDLYEAIHRFLYRVPGGIAISNIFACTIFAAMSGSSPATAAAIGTSGIPEMRKRGISDSLACGTIVGGGTLGILIPPSITLIVYGIATEISIGQLFIGGIVPGIIISLAFSCWIIIYMFYSRRKGQRQAAASGEAIVREHYSWSEKMRYLPKTVPFILLIICILYVIYFGVATPSEAAAIGALGSIVLTLIFYRAYITKGNAMEIIRATANQTGMLMLIATTTMFFSNVMTEIGLTQQVANLAGSVQGSKWLTLAVINMILLVMGAFLPPFVIILLTAPLLLPLIKNLGLDPIWFGVMMTVNMEIGCITPPFGLNLFVVKGIAPDVRMPTILRGSIAFVVILILSIVAFTIFPELVLWLPNKMAPAAMVK